jgi:hypothetical protein
MHGRSPYRQIFAKSRDAFAAILYDQKSRRARDARDREMISQGKKGQKAGERLQRHSRRLIRLLLAADEAFDEISPAYAKAKQGHSRRLRHLNGRSSECRGTRSQQSQGCYDNPIHDPSLYLRPMKRLTR